MTLRSNPKLNTGQRNRSGWFSKTGSRGLDEVNHSGCYCLSVYFIQHVSNKSRGELEKTISEYEDALKKKGEQTKLMADEICLLKDEAALYKEKANFQRKSWQTYTQRWPDKEWPTPSMQGTRRGVTKAQWEEPWEPMVACTPHCHRVAKMENTSSRCKKCHLVVHVVDKTHIIILYTKYYTKYERSRRTRVEWSRLYCRWTELLSNNITSVGFQRTRELSQTLQYILPLSDQP